ncbi:substrate-binding domain-containing protein [Pelagibacteraceae bacterium]|nr:substrate-binding domain-containing protein [Pelagibacteraceae bacterium]
MSKLQLNNILKLLILIIILFNYSKIYAKENVITIASTTSTHDTGLLKSVNKSFYDIFKIKVNVISLGTGQAIRIAKDGNVEILLVHHTPSEVSFMDKGYGKIRHNLMYNDFVLIGPKTDQNPCNSIEEKFLEIKNNRLNFISRGDDSGTHKKEIELWKLINVNANSAINWYSSVGQGMGQTLLIANNKKAYTLSDRSTWISFNSKENLKIVCENLPPLFNQYGIILVNNELNKNLNIKEAQIYVNWIISDEAKEIINNYKKNGQQLFFFNHH